jgi:hypothetical protein
VLYTVGTPPEVHIESPTDGEIVHEDTSVAVSATVSDGEDLPTAVSLVWESDVEGQLSTQGADSAGNLSFMLSALSVGEHGITVTATDSDGLYATDHVRRTINGLPSSPGMALAPDPAFSDDVLVASATGSSDAEGSTISYSYAWYNGGQLSTASTGSILPASATSKDETWSVVVSPIDTDGGIGPAGSAAVAISNTGPVVVATSILPASGVTTVTSLPCSASASAVDGETPTLSFPRDNATVGASLGVVAGLVLSPNTSSLGDSISCTSTAPVTATDADGGSASANDNVTNENSVPTRSTSGTDNGPSPATRCAAFSSHNSITTHW